MKLQEKYDKRTALITDMRAVLDGAKDGILSAEEQSKYDSMESDLEKLEKGIKQDEKLAAAEAKLAEQADPEYQPTLRRTDGDSEEHFSANPAYQDAFLNGYVRHGRAAMETVCPQRLAALQVGTDSEGGYIVPEEFETRIYEILDTLDPIRQVADVIRTRSDRNIPIESSVGTFGWIAEEGAYGESDPAFGQVVLQSHKGGGIVKVSEELLQDAFFDLARYLSGVAARRYNTLEESAFANGDNSGKPEGVFQASGVSNYDGAVSATAAITGDDLIETQHTLGRAYRQNAKWLVSDAMVKLIRKVKDQDDQYIWQPGLTAGAPDRLLGADVLVSDGAPAPAVSTKSIIYGDFQFYVIADRLGMVMQRLNELYAANGQIGFRFTKRTDGHVVDSNAFASFTHGAAS